MSARKSKAKRSSNLLNSLDDMKDREFGRNQLTFEDVPQLDGEANNNSIGEGKKKRALSPQNCETPRTKRRKDCSVDSLESSTRHDRLLEISQNGCESLRDSVNDIELSGPKDITLVNEEVEEKDKFLSEDKTLADTESVELDGAVSSISFARKKAPKPKELTPAEKEAKQKQILGYLQNFVHVSSLYSEYLEGRISSTSSKGTSAAKRTTQPATPKKKPDVSKSLKYFTGKLHPYQLEGVNWLALLYENSINGILADEMGLGKTVQIIALFCYLFEQNVPGPFLVVVPLSTLGNWESEFKRFAAQIPVVRVQGTSAERALQKRKAERLYHLDGRKVRPVVLVSYQVPQPEEAFLQKFTWQYIVIDEAQRIKNVDTKLSQQLRALHSVNRTLLTGTPLQNDIKELWALFNFLMPEIFQDSSAFSSLLGVDDMRDKDKLIENEVKNKVITTIHKVLAPFMLRREKKFVLDEIVPKKEVIIFCSLTKMQDYLYRATLQQDNEKLMMVEVEKLKPQPGPSTGRLPRACKAPIRYDKIGFPSDWETGNYVFVDNKSELKVSPPKCKNPFVRDKIKVPFDCPDCQYMVTLTMNNTMMMLRKIVDHPYLVWCPIKTENGKTQVFIDDNVIKQSGKLLVLDALLPKLKQERHKVLIFSTLVMFLDMIEEMLLLRGYNYRKLVGSSDYDSRNEYINDFMTDPDVFIFLLSTRAGGLGLNLTAADTVIFMDRDWNPMVDIQAQDRCHRIGQTKPVMVYSLICKGTIDEVVLDCGDMKRRLERVVLQEGKFTSVKKGFDGDEVKRLEDMLNSEQKLTEIKPNGLRYTDEELDQILDRHELWEEMKKKEKQRKKQAKSH